MKKRIVTIAGRPGSGKSSTAKEVASLLGFEHFSSGDLFRALGKEQGTDVLQANLSAENNKRIDLMVDAKLREIGDHQEAVVIDSRTAWHWIPESFKVFLNLDLQVAAERILSNMDDARLASEHIHRDAAEYADVLKTRLASEERRYKALYNINPYDMQNYDLVLDTAQNSLNNTVELVISAYQRWISE